MFSFPVTISHCLCKTYSCRTWNSIYFVPQQCVQCPAYDLWWEITGQTVMVTHTHSPLHQALYSRGTLEVLGHAAIAYQLAAGHWPANGQRLLWRNTIITLECVLLANTKTQHLCSEDCGTGRSVFLNTHAGLCRYTVSSRRTPYILQGRKEYALSQSGASERLPADSVV